MYPKLITKIVLICLLATAWVSAENFRADSTQSSVKFKIKCLMLGSVTGNFNHFSGQFDLDKGKLKSFNAKCYTKSIDTGNTKRDKDLQSANFFYTTLYPEMTLKMLSLKKNIVLIQLTIKGITKQVEFDYKPSRKMSTSQESRHPAFSLHGQIYLKDFDLNLHSAVGTGSIVLGKTVKIIAEIKGIKSPLLTDNSLTIQYNEK